MFGEKIQQMKQVVQNPTESERIQRIAHILAEIERAQTASTNDLADALDADAVETDPVDYQERREEILDLFGAMAPGDGDLIEWYVDHRLSDLGGDPDRLRAYVQMPPEEWAAQMDERDREECDDLVRDEFGADSLEWWERNVIQVEESDILRDGMMGHLINVQQRIDAATEHVEDGDE